MRYIYIYIHMYMQSDIIFVEKCECECECECKKVEKWGKRECDFSSLVFHVSHPNCLLSLSDFASPKVFSLSYFPGCIRPESPALFSYYFFFVFAFSLFALTRQPSLFHQSKIPLSKEEL